MTLNIQPHPPQPSVSERRGQRLAPLQTNFSRPTARLSSLPVARTQQRPRPSDATEATGERVPLQPPPVKRQSSKSGLRSLFGREKAARKPHLNLNNHNDSKLAEIDEGQSVSVSQTDSALDAPVLSPSLCATPKTALTTPTLVTSPTVAHSQRAKIQAKNSNPRSAKSGEDKPPANDPSWKPPPLFQAYPQSIKHGTLSAPALSADSILRIHATSSRGSSSRDEEMQIHNSQVQNSNESADANAARKKKEDKEKKHLRSLSETIGKTDWTQKIYVLATSGYILQYAGSGKHDRLPEKMMQLGPKSVAFASDAIPGKHWVLQVSQSSEEDGTTALETPKPLFSRLGFHRSHTRRLARSFLMVFDTPDELSYWLLAVRAEIEARGGKKYVSERVFDDGMESQLRSKPSVRQMVTKDPNRFSNSFLQPQQTGAGIAEEHEQSIAGMNSRRSSYISVNRRSIVNQPTPDSRSGSVSTTQTDAVASPITSPGSGRFYSTISASSSPMVGNGAAPAPGSTSLDAPRSPTFASPRKRQSMYMYIPKPSATPSMEAAKLPRPQSTAPDPLVRSTSPPAPNFSVPSFSKRFASRTPQLSQIPQIPIHPSLRDYDDDDEDDINAIASFPSPPQSPSRSISSSGRKESTDQHIMTPREAVARKQIRVSNSEDSLADPQRSQEPKIQSFPRAPRGSMISPSNHNHTPRPISFVAEDDPSPSTSSNDLPQHPPPPAEDRRQQQPQSGRTSILYQTHRAKSPAPPKMAHRKSMPGLSAGPPSAPPPNCPLPKIPSPIDPPSTEVAWEDPASSAAQSCKSPPPKAGRERRKSSAGAAAPPTYSYTPRPSMANRRPSMPNRI
ncbi:hypothetical protein ASPWEDRAFT_116943 [Aspergillus wentii DTO 134E9]|uniref:PH domain-containing protein n=1 Tax=Aspergillus wentii DTO 134E9 TaxID=1073089 RepID=A0A1L9RBU9_ASPWE|nr:uncharacterized protein ASPWEDRAFT_116943 [Aspergillus wentii DTO 134E9]KAI9934949.1 hypothetical protein MW887_000570 [Aspergillus wentii]OJJ32391.1 hypothetical protein ASPWEDRAFT_116943 [Aspergillus wentii DTO 134E9]